jgi:hypothetical protein
MDSPTALIETIELAFAHRSLPSKVIEMEGRLQIDSDIDDALWFQGRDWHDLTLEDWQQRHWGFGYLAPEGFAYFLPSVLTLTLRNPNKYPDLAVQSFIWQLDRTPAVENLDPPIYERYLEFTNKEFETIKEWMLWACENIPNIFYGAASGGPGDGFGRAFDTLLLLQEEARKHRSA